MPFSRTHQKRIEARQQEVNWLHQEQAIALEINHQSWISYSAFFKQSIVTALKANNREILIVIYVFRAALQRASQWVFARNKRQTILLDQLLFNVASRPHGKVHTPVRAPSATCRIQLQTFNDQGPRHDLYSTFVRSYSELVEAHWEQNGAESICSEGKSALSLR